uniref:GDT1 family protein n=1 Tax=Dunaliella tertiolecta TaxID=3047 RepID=A0A7S3QVE1_DUNTE
MLKPHQWSAVQQRQQQCVSTSGLPRRQHQQLCAAPLSQCGHLPSKGLAGQAKLISGARPSTSSLLQHSRTSVIVCSHDSSAGEGAEEQSAGPVQKKGNEQNNKWLVAGSIIIGTATILGIAVAMGTPQGAILKDVLVNGPLGKSGFLAAFSLIFLSEIGDKTFFIAALLAAKLGKWISFAGSLSSLSLMSIVSVAIGAIFSRVPDALKSTLPIGELAGVVLLAFFGINSLKEGLQSDEGGGSSVAEEELQEANEAVTAAEQGGRMQRTEPVKAFFEVASLVFIAEWGDRSMLATIALGAAQNPVGVASGAVMGHAIATGKFFMCVPCVGIKPSARKPGCGIGKEFYVRALHKG